MPNFRGQPNIFERLQQGRIARGLEEAPPAPEPRVEPVQAVRVPDHHIDEMMAEFRRARREMELRADAWREWAAPARPEPEPEILERYKEVVQPDEGDELHEEVVLFDNNQIAILGVDRDGDSVEELFMSISEAGRLQAALGRVLAKATENV